MRHASRPGGGAARRWLPALERLMSDVETKERALDEVTALPKIAADQRASLFVFPTSAEPVLAPPPVRQVERMNDAAEHTETSELRATILLFALVLLLPTLLGCALLGMR
jgi:hypothetical protein